LRHYFFNIPIILCIILFTPDNVRGQGFGFGIKSGFNFANLSSETESSAKFGLNGGIFFSWKFTKLKVKPEILYSHQGAESVGLFQTLGTSNNFSNSKSTAKLSYVNIPLMVEWQLTPEFHLNAGPQLGLLLSAQQETIDVRSGSLFNTTSTKTTEDIKDQLKSSDLGLGFGVGFDFPFGLGIDIRYTLGLSNIDDSGLIDLKNRVVMLGFSYSFIK